MENEALVQSRRERKKQQVEADIRRAALRLFQDKGVKETSVEEILEAADISKGTFYNYFPSKDAVLARIAERSVEQITAALMGSPNQANPLRMLEEAYEKLVDDMFAWRKVARYVASAETFQGVGMHTVLETLFVHYVAQAQELGIFTRAYSSGQIAQMLTGSYYAALFGLDQSVPNDACKVFLKHQLAMQLSGIAPPATE